MSTKFLKQYLDSHFSVGNTWTNDELVSHFLTEFGVNVKFENHTDGKFLFQFKYDMISAKWLHDITHECRGIILRNSIDGWEIMAQPFNKFFNQHEGHCRIFKKEDFAAECDKLSFVEKADGTCCVLWFDKYLSKWRISTLGSITTTAIHDSGVTFDTLFAKTLGNETQVNDFFKLLTPGATYIFELCSILNRVVTRYPSDCVYILGARDVYGSFVTIEVLQNIFMNCGIKVPKKIKLTDIGIASLEDAQAWVEKQVSDRSYGEYPEGFVVTDEFGPVCKMKNSAYLALHHSLSDPACTRKAVIAAFFKGTMDDLYPALPEPFQKLADKLKDWLNGFKNYLNTDVANSLKSQPFNTRKEYALYVQGLPEPEIKFRSFFFCLQEEICDPNKNLGETFSNWICQNFDKYEDYFKSFS